MERGGEYPSRIVEAMTTGEPASVYVNVPNEGYIDNLDAGGVVEVEAIVDRDGIHPQPFGALAPQLAALDRRHLEVHDLAVTRAARARSRARRAGADARPAHVGGLPAGRHPRDVRRDGRSPRPTTCHRSCAHDDAQEERHVPRAHLALAVAAAIVARPCPPVVATTSRPHARPRRRPAPSTMADFSYEPSCVEAAPGDSLEIVNEGQSPHTFTVESDGAQAEVDVAAGEQATLTVPDLAAGTYRVVCTYHPQMEAALRIGG